MSTFNFVNNALGQLFDVLEPHTGTRFATFNMDETEKVEQGIDGAGKVYMQKYKKTRDEHMYKYLYDPDMSFDDRFHQRIASIGIKDRGKPWITLMFNTGAVQSLTNVHSCNQYMVIQNSEGDPFEIQTKKVRVPVNLVLVSNEASYLYAATERLALFFDRIINFQYCEYIQFPSGVEDECERSGQCMDITEVDLEALDTESRGSLVTSAYNFGLVYWVTKYPEQVKVLEKITLDIAVKNMGNAYTLTVQ